MKKILIYEANSNQALSLSKYIKRNGDFYIVGCVEKAIQFNKENYDEIIINNFLDVNIEGYLYILPMGASSSYQVINKYKELKYFNNIKFNNNNLIVFDKPKLLDIANSLDIPSPKTFYNKKDIESFPIFYKENFENGGGARGVAYVLNQIPINEKLIFQEYIDTPATYGVGFLAKDGVILTHTTHKELISFPIDGGSAVAIEKFEDSRLLKYTQQFIKKVDYNGWGLAEYKYCNHRDDFVFMEINGKFWASIEFVLQNNPNFLLYLLDIRYKEEKLKRLLFINRLFQYDFINIIKKIKYIFNCNIIKESSLSYQIIRKLIPTRLVSFIKSILK